LTTVNWQNVVAFECGIANKLVCTIAAAIQTYTENAIYFSRTTQNLVYVNDIFTGTSKVSISVYATPYGGQSQALGHSSRHFFLFYPPHPRHDFRPEVGTRAQVLHVRKLG